MNTEQEKAYRKLRTRQLLNAINDGTLGQGEGSTIDITLEDLTIQEGQYDETLLMAAVRTGNNNVANFLLEKYSNKFNEQYTVIKNISNLSDYIDEYKYFNNFDLNLKTSEGVNVLIYTILYKNVEMFNQICKKIWNMQPYKGKTRNETLQFHLEMSQDDGLNTLIHAFTTSVVDVSRAQRTAENLYPENEEAQAQHVNQETVSIRTILDNIFSTHPEVINAPLFLNIRDVTDNNIVDSSITRAPIPIMRTPLMFYAERNYRKHVTNLIELGANVDYQIDNPYNNITALMGATIMRNYEMALYLITEHNANVNIVNRYTPQDPYLPNESKNTVLMYAIGSFNKSEPFEISGMNMMDNNLSLLDMITNFLTNLQSEFSIIITNNPNNPDNPDNPDNPGNVIPGELIPEDTLAAILQAISDPLADDANPQNILNNAYAVRNYIQGLYEETNALFDETMNDINVLRLWRDTQNIPNSDDNTNEPSDVMAHAISHIPSHALLNIILDLFDSYRVAKTLKRDAIVDQMLLNAQDQEAQPPLQSELQRLNKDIQNTIASEEEVRTISSLLNRSRNYMVRENSRRRARYQLIDAILDRITPSSFDVKESLQARPFMDYPVDPIDMTENALMAAIDIRDPVILEKMITKHINPYYLHNPTDPRPILNTNPDLERIQEKKEGEEDNQILPLKISDSFNDLNDAELDALLGKHEDNNYEDTGNTGIRFTKDGYKHVGIAINRLHTMLFESNIMSDPSTGKISLMEQIQTEKEELQNTDILFTDGMNNIESRDAFIAQATRNSHLDKLNQLIKLMEYLQKKLEALQAMMIPGMGPNIAKYLDPKYPVGGLRKKKKTRKGIHKKNKGKVNAKGKRSIKKRKSKK